MVFSTSGAVGSVGNGVEERRARRPTAEHALPRKGGAAGPSWRGPPGPHVSIQRPMGPLFLGQSKIPSQLHTVVSSQQIILKNKTNYSTVPNHITVTSHSKKKTLHRLEIQLQPYNKEASTKNIFIMKKNGEYLV
jgi:hypothetical protein